MNFRQRIYTSLFLSLSLSTVSAQYVKEVPLEDNPILEQRAVQQSGFRNNQVCPTQTLTLPFFDDFSQKGQPVYHPNCDNWTDNQAFINNHMAYMPPSIGVATLDGLDHNGFPYDKSAAISVGSPADTLTSQYIDLSTKTVGDSVILSFYYQKEGLADRPDTQDSLLVEFRDSSSNWVKVFVEAGVPYTTPAGTLIDFQKAFIVLGASEFFHEEFQFRFRNLATITGNNDHWHIDYVYMDENRTSNTTTLFRSADVAFSAEPISPLKQYTAMPWRHFTTDAWADSIFMYQRNLSSSVGTVDRIVTITEQTTGTQLLNEPIPAVTYPPSNSSSTLIDEDTLLHTIFNPFSSFIPAGETTLETKYIFTNTGGLQANPRYVYNDTATLQTELDNYFAYDDGTAEMRIIAQNVGTMIAVEYTAVVDDSLRGVYFHMPHFRNRDSETDFINLKVWTDNLNNEVFSMDFLKLKYIAGFNGFYYVELKNIFDEKQAVALTAGQKFYVGWQQASTTSLPIGLDKSRDASHKAFVGVGSWIPMDIKGAVMMRPLLSPIPSYDYTVGSKEVLAIEQTLTIYPNPVTNTLNLSLDTEQDGYELQLSNTLGQIVWSGKYTDQIDMSDFAKGLYILQLSNADGQVMTTQKIVKQ